jgi:hypothetical protein
LARYEVDGQTDHELVLPQKVERDDRSRNVGCELRGVNLMKQDPFLKRKHHQVTLTCLLCCALPVSVIGRPARGSGIWVTTLQCLVYATTRLLNAIAPAAEL